MLTRVCNVFSIDFVEKSRFECCFWSVQCIEAYARTSDNVKTWVFISLKLQWWSFIDNFVFCNILWSIKAALLELEKAMFTGATPVPMFTIITPGTYTHSKQSKPFHAQCNLMVNCEKKIGLITKSGRMSVTDLNQTLRYICHVVDVCSKLHDFQDCCLFNMSDQLVFGIVFGCFWLKNYKNIVLRYSMTNKQYLYVEEFLK